MEYKVLTSDESDELTKLVNWDISEGWEPLGSVSISAYAVQTEYRGVEYGSVLAQAMIRSEANKQAILDKERAERDAKERDSLRVREAGSIVATKFNPDDAMRVLKWVPNFEDKLETVTKVKIVQAVYTTDMETYLNGFLKDGWMLHGDMIKLTDCVNQMIIKEVPKEDILTK